MEFGHTFKQEPSKQGKDTNLNRPNSIQSLSNIDVVSQALSAPVGN